MSKTSFSHHIFIFPFKWNLLNSKIQHDIFENSKIKGKSNPQDIVNSHNESSYFYNFIHPAILGTSPDSTESIARHSVDNFSEGATYEISIGTERNKESFDKTYTLSLNSIKLSIYKTGVGTISFHCENNEYKNIDDILNINDFGRRLYPQFLKLSGDKVSLSKVHQTFLAKSINITTNNKSIKLLGNLTRFKQGTNGVSENFTKFIREEINQLTNNEIKDKLNLQPILDDRMFVVCHYYNDEISKELSQNGSHLVPEIADKWMQFIFVDNNGNSCQSPEMAKRLLEKHTYDRWINYGTLYGVTRYSLVCLSNLEGREITLPHMKGVYFQMVQLALVQRASLLHFSDEVAKITHLSKKDAFKESESLYKEYLKFINRIHFREVTAQEQGIDIYNLLHEAMDMERQSSGLSDEIEGLHSFISLQSQIEQANDANWLAKLAAIFLVPSLLLAIFNITPEDKLPPYTDDGRFWLSLILIVIVSYIFYYFINKQLKR